MVIYDKIRKIRQQKGFIGLWTREPRGRSRASGITGSRDWKTMPPRFWFCFVPPSTQFSDSLLNSFFPSGDWLCHVLGEGRHVWRPLPLFWGWLHLGWGRAQSPVFEAFSQDSTENMPVCVNGMGWSEEYGRKEQERMHTGWTKANRSPLSFPSLMFFPYRI